MIIFRKRLPLCPGILFSAAPAKRRRMDHIIVRGIIEPDLDLAQDNLHQACEVILISDDAFRKITIVFFRQDPSFKNELNLLLKDYVGRPSPLYFANNLSEKYKRNIYLKR